MNNQSKIQAINEPDRTQTFKGIGILLLAGLGFTISMLFANMAFNDGVDLNTSNAMRYGVATVLLIIYQKTRTKKIRLLPRERYISLALGIPVFMMGVGYLGATQYIPISLAVLIFYTCPFFVAIISRFTENEPITITRLTAIILAFIGLSLALKVQTTGSFQILGIMYAMVAAIGFASFVTVSSLILKTADRQAVLLQSLAAGTILFLLFFVLTNGVEIIGTRAGWLKVSGSGIVVAFAYIAFFAGMKIIGPVKATIIMNIEPVLTICLAAILLGERLSNIQVFGAVMVIGGVVLITCTPKT
ncbi:MAG: DMT family transporter [Deltaproteobacteria bacterium]|nr:DMT family transporter [Deltaproteobacteria bacterium]